jgi:two-component system, NtrC family, response regulator HydG
VRRERAALVNRAMSGIRNKSILVIDDDLAMLRALTKVLADEGALVAGAANSVSAMEYLLNQDQLLDLIITDIRMPLLDGMEVLEIVKANRPNIPVIVITAYGGPEAEAQSRRLGAAAHLEKPLDTSQLLAAITRALASPTP